MSPVLLPDVFLGLFLFVGMQGNIYPGSVTVLPYKIRSQQLWVKTILGKHGMRDGGAPAPPVLGTQAPGDTQPHRPDLGDFSPRVTPPHWHLLSQHEP